MAGVLAVDLKRSDMEKLKIEVDTSDIKQATDALNLLAQAAERAEATLAKLGIISTTRLAVSGDISSSGTVTLLSGAAGAASK